MSGSTVDVAALYEALDSKRQAEQLSWRGLAHHLEVAPSMFTRMAQGRRPDVDTFAALLGWLGMPVEAFVEPAADSTKMKQESIAKIGTYLRMDRNLTPEAATALENLIRLAYERLRNHPPG